MITPTTRYRPRQRGPGNARALPAQLSDGFRQRLDAAKVGMAEPFKGVTTGGRVMPGLFAVGGTGVATGDIAHAAGALLASLSPAERGVALDNDEHSRRHIHTVVRTPNGNDYGKDLLRQHRERSAHGMS